MSSEISEVIKQEKKRYYRGKHLRQTEGKRTKKTYMSLQKEEMKGKTEAALMDAHNQALATNDVKIKIHKQQGSALCRTCKEEEESGGHVLRKCSKLAQTHYKSSHDRVADIVHEGLCQKYGL